MSQYLLTVMDQPRTGAAARSWTDHEGRRRRARQMQAAGRLGVRGRPAPAATATVLRPKDGDVLMIDGPYIEGKEHVAGSRSSTSPDLDAALGWGRAVRRADRPPDRGASLPVTRRGGRARSASSASTTGGPSPSSSASSATSTPPRRRCRTRSSPPSRAGRPTASRPARPAGSSRRRGTGPSTGCAGRAPAPTGTPRPRCCTRDPEPVEEGPVPDDRLRMVFTCCHPALAVPAQVALTLRLLGGLTTAEIARGVPGARADDGAAAGAGEGEDPRRPHPLPGADRGRAARPAARGARRGLPGVHRGPPGDVGRRGWCATTCAPRRSGSAGCWPR